MPSTLSESTTLEKKRAELQAVLQSPLFVRSPTLTHLLSHLCEKTFAGEGDQIKEYSIAVDVFGRPDSFDQDVDSIVRVEANRLRKRLAEYYSGEGASHRMRITVPVGQYIPVFVEVPPCIFRGHSSRENRAVILGGANYSRATHLAVLGAYRLSCTAGGTALPGKRQVASTRVCAFCSPRRSLA